MLRTRKNGKSIRLYEKYRPERFNQVIGQEKAVAEIREVVKRGIGGKALWITGRSGIGKTSLARITAKQTKKSDIYEFTSPTDFDSKFLKNLKQKFIYRSLNSEFITYIVNEAHLLTKGTIISLLSILEKLPENYCFIFTTTLDGEEQFKKNKDSKPFLSRCIRIKLTDQKLSELFINHCMSIADTEGKAHNGYNDFKNITKETGLNLRAMLNKVEVMPSA